MATPENSVTTELMANCNYSTWKTMTSMKKHNHGTAVKISRTLSVIEIISSTTALVIMERLAQEPQGTPTWQTEAK